MTTPPSLQAFQANAHPEGPLEAEHLAETLRLLESRIAEIGGWNVQGFTTHDTAALHRKLVEIYNNLKAARQQVYFGRLDITPAGAGESETHYIGKLGFERGGRIVVVDWRAPAARLFSRRRPGPAEYDSPDGTLAVELHLKRHFEIEHEALRGMADEYDTRPSALPAEERPALIDPDAFLRDILSGRQAVQMRDIVTTIQEHQDDLIRADPRQVLVVQGVAGSGKTSIALHRVAFLLYPGNQTGINPERVIVFGPNRLFLGYIANVLPGLGVGSINQTTLDDWALERLGLAGQRVADRTLPALLSAHVPEQEKRRLARRSELKASLRMGKLLDQYAEWWRARFTPALPAQGFTYAGLGPLMVAASLSRARALELHRSVAQLPLRRHRQRFVELAGMELMGDYATNFDRQLDELLSEGEQLRGRQRQLSTDAARLEDYAVYVRQHGNAELERQGTAEALEQGAAGLRALADFFGQQGEATSLRAERIRDEANKGKDRPEIRAAVLEALEADLDRLWPDLEPAPAYAALLEDARLLARLGRGIFSSEEIELLTADGQPPDPAGHAALDASDLPALCYLHTAINGVPAPLYDHVVVDEAQDAPPLYYAVLRRLSRTGSFTILGDLAQGVYSYRGIAGWDDVRRAFQGLPYTFADVRESYRSTHEIISFGNRMLELLASPDEAPRLAQPFERHGRPVRIARLDRAEELAPALAEAIRWLRQAGYENIAVITKSADECGALGQELEAAGAGPVQAAAAAERAYEGGVLVLPVHLAKGMEFEAVLISGADEATYSASDFDGRLLYVAATRALHALEIYAVGQAAVVVELAAERK